MNERLVVIVSGLVICALGDDDAPCLLLLKHLSSSHHQYHHRLRKLLFFINISVNTLCIHRFPLLDKKFFVQVKILIIVMHAMTIGFL